VVARTRVEMGLNKESGEKGMESEKLIHADCLEAMRQMARKG
jgi:DNA modification methylase